MGEFVGVKRKKMRSILIWVQTLPRMSVKEGGKHQVNVNCDDWERPFPICFKYNEINKVYVKGLMKLMVKSKVCTEEEFKSQI